MGALDDPGLLETLYWHEDMDAWEIAERHNAPVELVREKLIQYGVDTQPEPPQNKDTPVYFKNVRGYDRIYHNYRGKTIDLYYHQLIAILGGEDPHDVFAEDTVVHHKNKIKYDNRVENLEVMSRAEHTRKHVN